jgi:hypothetical protein
MKKTAFKVGDKVYCVIYGWGIITKLETCDSEYPIIVEVLHQEGEKMEKSYTADGCYYTGYNNIPTLSFTEYTLNGFSQERPVELPEVGEEIIVSDNGTTWVIGRFREYNPQYKFPVEAEFAGDDEIYSYSYFKRLR